MTYKASIKLKISQVPNIGIDNIKKMAALKTMRDMPLADLLKMFNFKEDEISDSARVTAMINVPD